jgi:hypothetical protein
MRSDSNNSWITTLLSIFTAAVVLSLLMTGIALTLTSWRCGTGMATTNVFSGAILAVTGDTSTFTVPANCTPPVVGIRIADLTLLLVLIASAAVAVVAWLRYRQSDRYFTRQMNYREGLAKPGEIRKHVSAHAVLRRAATLRPNLQDPSAASVGWKVGRSHSRDVYVSIEDSVVVEGAPRSGKGYRFIINAILDWSGPLITTSTRNDNLAATMKMRANTGQVTVFDPQELSGVRSSLRISPVAGCEDPLVADQRGQAIVSGTALGASSSNQEWAQVSASVLSRLLHAAAVSGRDVGAIARWGSNPKLALEAVEVLRNDGAPGWGDDLVAIINGVE